MQITSIRLDAETLKALDYLKAHESKIRLHEVTNSEMIRYAILKVALDLKQQKN